MPSSTSPTPTSGRVWEHPRNGHLGPFPGPPVIAFDVGGTHLRCVVVEPDGTLAHFEKDRIVSVPSGAEPEEVKRVLVETMADYVARVQPALEPDSPIAVSVPAPADRSGVIYTAAPLFGETCPTFELGERVGRATGRPCHVVNDVSAAAWYLSERMAADRFLVVTVSSSIGCKVFDRSRRYAVLDDTDYAGEIGHVTVDETPDAPRCDCCGRRGPGDPLQRGANRTRHSRRRSVDHGHSARLHPPAGPHAARDRRGHGRRADRGDRGLRPGAGERLPRRPSGDLGGERRFRHSASPSPRAAVARGGGPGGMSAGSGHLWTGSDHGAGRRLTRCPSAG